MRECMSFGEKYVRIKNGQISILEQKFKTSNQRKYLTGLFLF